MVELFAVVVVTHPVRVVENVCAAQRLHQSLTILKVEWVDLYLPVERIVTADGVGQCADPLALIE
tara:strand:- start:436 stop:630 length:195 start_codon:yes stop_codon:yes gene_type:complete